MSETNRPARPRRSILYGIVRGLAYVAFHTLYPLRIHHGERLDREAPFIIIGNHNSWLDPLAMCYRIHGQQAVFVAKKELVRNPIARAALREIGIIAVDRHHSDMEAMRRCIRTLREGRILAIFPEGTRHHTGLMDEVETGASLLALRSGAPLLPVYLDRKFRLFRRVHMYVGETIPFADLAAAGVDRETTLRLSERITQTYAEMARQARD